MNRSRSKPRSKKSKAGKFDIYIHKVLKQVHPECSLSANTKSQINYFLNLIATKIIAQAVFMLSGRKTISPREIQSAVKIVFPEELARHSVSEGTKAITKFMSADEIGKQKTDRSAKAGLVFSVSRVENIIRDNFNDRVGEGAPVYLTAVLEYITAELLELSGNAARDYRKNTIQPRYLMLAIENDMGLKKLAQNVDFDVLGGGVVPNIMPALLRNIESKTKKSTPRRKKSTPRRKKSTPRRKKSTPRRKSSIPRRKKSHPRRKKSTPRRKSSIPRRKKSN